MSKKLIKRPTLSLPLAQAEGNVMIVAIIAVLVFLSGLIWLAGSAAHHMAGRWNQTLSNELTIEITPKLNDENTLLPPVDERIESVKEALAQYNAVIKISTVSQDELHQALKPWLGDVSAFPDLPLPTLLNISLRPGHDINMDNLAAQISKTIPGVRVIAHYAWAGEVQRLAGTISLLAWSGMGLMAMVLLMVITFTTRARLTMFGAEVEILHTLGATDGFVAGEFERQAFRLSIWGAFIGFGILIAVLYAIITMTMPEAFTMLHHDGGMELLQDWHQEILGLLALPLLVIFLNTMAARVAVTSALRRLI